MDSRSPMIQIYRDNEQGSVGEHAPFLSSEPPAASPQPRWAKASTRRTRFRRIALAAGAFATIYLLFCTWFSFAHGATYSSFDDAGFPHPRLPWPFPHRHPHHPRPHPGPPHHPHFFPPKPVVLACTAIPTPSSLTTLESVKLNVTIPGHKAVVLHDHLLHGDVSVSKLVPESEVAAQSEGKSLEVSITVANRTFHHHPPSPPHSFVSDSEEEEEDKEPEAFVLCAITFEPHHPPKHHDDELITNEEPPAGHPPYPHGHPHFSPPVIVTVLPAHNETYPKLPGHCPHHPPGHPPHEPSEEAEVNFATFEISHRAVFSRAWRSTITFLFPMLRLSQNSSFHPHVPHAPFHHHPPPPPFAITSVTVTVPQFVPVKYGLPFRGPFPHHHPHHPRH